MKINKWLYNNAVIFLVALSLISSPSSFLLPNVHAISVEDEQKKGKEVALYGQYTDAVLDNGFVRQYFNELGQYLIRPVETKHFNFHFYIINDKTVNAFATFAGHIFFYTGLINIMDSIDGDVAHAYGVDLGARYFFPPIKGVSFNIVAKNFGGKMGEFVLARELAFSVLYTLTVSDITFTVDYDVIGKISNYPLHRAGIEVKLPYIVTLRAGYQTDNTTITEGFKDFTFGVGLNISDKFIDFAYEPYGDLGNAYKVSFGGDF